MVRLNESAPHFLANAYVNDSFEEIDLYSFRGKFVILFFYPADFSFVCPTELEDLANYYEAFKEKDVEVLAISTDSHFVHAAWHNSSSRIKNIKFPMISDSNHVISKVYGVLQEADGFCDRATFIIDPDGIIKGIEISDNSVGRSAKELMRKVNALIYSRKNPDLACPANWESGKEALKPGVNMVGKL
jgi:NADH-dependent peroxiredoxin subunit C